MPSLKPIPAPTRNRKGNDLMTTAFLAIIYLAFGLFWWRRIVITCPAPNQPEEWHRDLIEADARSDVALLVAKGTFILLWPLALGVGWLSARLT